MPAPAPTVWIVDDDLGFVCWLGEIFTTAGCQALPALSCPDAIKLTQGQSTEPDLIVLNPRLPGAAGMVQRWARARRPPMIVSIGASPTGIPASICVPGKLDRPFASELVSRPAWLERVRKLLRELETSNARQ